MTALMMGKYDTIETKDDYNYKDATNSTITAPSSKAPTLSSIRPSLLLPSPTPSL
jgi:hypothetical protein